MAEACMAEMWPRRGFSEVSPLKAVGAVGGGLFTVKGGTISRCCASNTSPTMKVAGNVSGVELKSLCP